MGKGKIVRIGIRKYAKECIFSSHAVPACPFPGGKVKRCEPIKSK
jgi:hypothetical protein